MNVFCCHSSADKDIVKPIALALLQDGHDVFLDEWSLVPGDSLVEKLPDAISTSGVFLLFLSEASKESAWCKRELAIAVSQMIRSSRVRVLAHRLQRVDPPLIIDDMVYIDAVTLGYEKSLERLKLAVEGKPAPAVAEAYSDIEITHVNISLEGVLAPPAPYHAAVRIAAKRFAHPRFYVRLTASSPLSTSIIRSVPGYDGMRTMIASAVHGHVLEHTEGPPGLEPEFPWLLVVFSNQPVAVLSVEFEEKNPFSAVSERAERPVSTQIPAIW
jgi:hypothetical protein